MLLLLRLSLSVSLSPTVQWLSGFYPEHITAQSMQPQSFIKIRSMEVGFHLSTACFVFVYQVMRIFSAETETVLGVQQKVATTV